MITFCFIFQLPGFSFAVASMVVAGGIETARRIDNNCVNQTIGSEQYYACMSIFYQIPQYGLIGISEVFTGVGGKCVQVCKCVVHEDAISLDDDFPYFG